MIFFIVQSYWFIPTTLYCWALAAIIRHKLGDHWAIHLACFALLCLLPKQVFWIKLWGLPFLYPFFAIGYLYRKKEHIYKPYYNKYGLIVFVITLSATTWLFSFYETKHYIYDSGASLWDTTFPLKEQIAINLFRFIIGLLGATTLIIGIDKISEYIPKTFQKKLIYLGQNSLGVYLIQEFIIAYIIRYVDWQGYTLEYPYISTFTLSLIVAMLCWEIISIIKACTPNLSPYLLGTTNKSAKS